ncbi:MAG: hypothetical protein P4M01_02565 [Acidobacteriota bacterium]|nr:hypothetical protein [Acidobacteriota bacterium]
MSDPAPNSAVQIPLPVVKELRRLAHDLSNSIETVMQASYLLSQAEMKETDRRWVTMIDQAARDSARINREIREVLRQQTTKSEPPQPE